HWPDSMFTYLGQDKVLFSQDAFGMHLASSERFADEIDEGVLDYEAAKYYANILLLYSPLVLKLFDKMTGLDLDIQVIAPDHGPIYREGLDWILSRWARWAAQKPTNKAVVVYDTMWGSTAKMAQAIGDGLAAGGARVKQMQLRACHRSDIATEVLDAGALLIGSPTINGEMFPTVADILTYMRGLKRQNLIGQAFGSYGWSKKIVDQLTDWLASMKVELVGDPVNVQYVPDDDALAQCYSLGRLVAERLNERCEAE
ncbi:MAG: FprA family A-type flavoprotein, partial [Armatimonadota bacterium]